MYKFKSQVRYSEALHTGTMNPISISNYLQDCATFHSASLGKDICYYKQIHRGWFLNSWQIDICRYPSYGETISIATWSYGIKGFYGYRNFTIQDEQKQLCVCANSIWFFTDTVMGQPIRVPEEEAAAYGSETKFPMEYCSRKINPPNDMQSLPEYLVGPYDIDTNGHVNNVRYIELAFQNLPKEIQCSNTIWRIRTEYKKAAKTNDMIYPYYAKTDIESIQQTIQAPMEEVVYSNENKQQYAFCLATKNLSEHMITANDSYANIIFYTKNTN